MLLRSTAQGHLPSPASAERPHSPPSGFRPRPFLPRRFRGPLLGLVIVLGAIVLLFRLRHLPNSIPEDLRVFLQDLLQPEGWYPPRFLEWHDREKQLPQLDPNLPYPQGREGRYIRFSNHVWGAFPQSIPVLFLSRDSTGDTFEGLGWGNIMQELLLNAHLAYLSKRMYAPSVIIISASSLSGRARVSLCAHSRDIFFSLEQFCV